MWDKVIEQVLPYLNSDSQLMALLGGPNIYRSRSRPRITTPVVTYTTVSDTLEENYAPCSIQWDIFAVDMDTVSKIQLRMYQLMHSDRPVVIGTMRMWSQFQMGFDYPNEEELIAHRAVEYKYTPARENG